METGAPTVRSTNTWWQVAALLAITLIAYAPAMRAGFIWDDPDYVINNYNLRDARGLARIWTEPRSLPQYYPLVHTTFWMEYQTWGLQAGGYHVVNILLHALAAILLWRVLVRLEIPGAWLAAAIFAVHPVHVESVAWITERKNVLSGVFYFAAALAYLRFDQRCDWRQYGVSLALFICALLSKSVTCSLPAALLVVIWWKRGRVTWREIGPIVPMLLLGAAMAFYTAHLEVNHVGAGGTEWNFTPLQRLIIAGRALWLYAGKIVLPVNLAFVYPKWALHSWQIVFGLCALIVIVALLALHRRIGRGPAAAVLLFVGTLLPALGFFNIYPMRYTFAADHYQYLASVGLIVLLVAVLLKFIPQRPASLVLVPLVVLTLLRASVFHDPLTLWADTVKRNPSSWMVNLNYAQALGRAHRAQEAEHHFKRAADLAPQLPETHWNLGVHLASLGRLDDAMTEYDRATALDPDYAGAYFSRGNVYLERGNTDDAKREYAKAIEYFPDYPQAHFQLGFIAEREGDATTAIEQYQRAIAGDPQYAIAHNSLGRLLVKQQKFDEALNHYRAAVRIQPDLAEAHLNLGALLARMGQLDEARQHVREAVRLDPSLSKYADQALRH